MSTPETQKALGVPFTFADEYAADKMIERAVRGARPHCRGMAPRWVAVRDVFYFGCTTSMELCRHFGLNPNELLEGIYPDPNKED